MEKISGIIYLSPSSVVRAARITNSLCPKNLELNFKILNEELNKLLQSSFNVFFSVFSYKPITSSEDK